MNKFAIVLFALLVAFATAQNCDKTTQVSTEGGTCDATNVCAGELSCVSGKCKFLPLEGDSCSGDADCTNFYYNLFCSSGKCTRRYKNQGESCVASGECSSLTCTGGSCAALTAGQNCTSNYCGSPSNALSCSGGICIATAANGGDCGQLDSTKATITQCVPGLVCVGTGNKGKCTPLATSAGAACVPSIMGFAIANTLCSANSGLACVDSKCARPTTVAVGGACSGLNVCDANTAACVAGTCVAYSSIPCPSGNCTTGVCNCPDATKPGTCGAPIATSCTTSIFGRLTDCSFTANTQNPVNACGSQYKALRCCYRSSGVGPLNKDITLAYCSSANQASFAFAALLAMIVMML